MKDGITFASASTQVRDAKSYQPLITTAIPMEETLKKSEMP